MNHEETCQPGQCARLAEVCHVNLVLVQVVAEYLSTHTPGRSRGQCWCPLCVRAQQAVTLAGKVRRESSEFYAKP